MSLRLAAAVGIVGVTMLAGADALYAQQPTEPINVSLVVPVTSPPLYDASGRPSPDATHRLDVMALRVGSLAKPGLERVPIGLAPSPMLCDELLHLKTPASARVVQVLRGLSTRSTVVASPYAEVRLPDLPDALSVRFQVASGRRELATCAGRRPSNVLLPPDVALDSSTLDALITKRKGIVLSSASRIGPNPVAYANVILLPTTIVVRDASVDQAVEGLGNARSIVAVLDPRRDDLFAFVSALAKDDRVRLVRLRDLATTATPRTVSFPAWSDPPRSYMRAIERASSALKRIRSYTLPTNPLVGILRTSLGRARGSGEWNDDWRVGRRRATAVVDTVRRTRDLVTMSGGSVTFTSRRGSVPVTVMNRNTFPIRVRVGVSSAKIDFPDGAARTVIVEPPGHTILFAAVARSTGTFPMRVRLTSPDRTVRFDGGDLIVRSIAANGPALWLTAGGAVFLLAWYARQVVQRRRDGGRTA